MAEHFRKKCHGAISPTGTASPTGYSADRGAAFAYGHDGGRLATRNRAEFRTTGLESISSWDF